MSSKEHFILRNLMQNSVSPWYFGNLSREEAQKAIFMEPDGTYLIRDCNQIPGSYVLLVKEKTQTNKYVISPSRGIWKIGNAEFDSIENLLLHFTKNIIRQSALTNPATKPFYRVLQSYHPNNDLELSVTEGQFVKFVLKYDEKILCENQLTKAMGWLPAKILKQSSNDKTSIQQMVFKIKNMVPFKTTSIKDRNPNVFDKTQLCVKNGDQLTILDVLDNGMLQAKNCNNKDGLVPFNIVRMSDFRLEM